ncbi:hypothetical protein GCM10025859_47850 [Alicyclobacillus fastidiosus]|nr:hypothetical protein GCM10025859_47850 [Alicyclobacillus fastidiosus]
MYQHSKVCGSVEEFIEALNALIHIDHATHFNLDGTWTISY